MIENKQKKNYGYVTINRLFKMKDTTLDFIKKLTGQSGNSFAIRETGKFLSDLINEIKIKYEIKE
jgi:hypothetical protein